ncbi:class I SAM-dependent methyltransferase [Streptomyces sp. TRM66268-LWL]|uniref:Class I SAM-dependent methyltransferase n=1 Tax=Streptomyces polyasparticus TaxID=2767826 RepID=A0ABR7SNM2_9ACTN|nr:class I SAM-dependent methyltransferase [Streptomyces polyasparticus]MBC9716290.1 class I SAM-dependent methyltransferase [Streptomyces polyasparticus]
MDRHGFLRQLHKVYRPRNYLEIGVNDGRSLRLSRVPTVAIDPAFKVTSEVSCDVHLVKATSDSFFERKDPLLHLRNGRNPFRALARRDPLNLFGGEPRLDMSFIDGMHLFEFALRDFMNVEKHSRWSSVIVLDDMLPRNVDEAARDRHTSMWTGDVFRVVQVLRRYRPDLVVVELDTKPTGVVAVFGADPANTVLKDNYDKIIGEFRADDPQDVPEEVLQRKNAIPGETLLGADFWPALIRARNLRRPRSAFTPIRRRIEAVVG